MHVGGGDISALERLALQVEGSSLFVDEFTRGLEALGHLQIGRDRELRPHRFELSPPYVAGLQDGSFLLVGYWPRSTRSRLRGEVESRGGALRGVLPTTGGVSSWTIEGLSLDDVCAVTMEADPNSSVVPDASRGILAIAQPISDVRPALPQWHLPGARRFEKFNLASSSWVQCPHAAGSGAFRLQASFMTTYVHQTEEEAAAGLTRLANAQLAKHLAAFESGRPLVSYQADSKQLCVPLGADLPGLLGRAAVLCSGRLLSAVPSRRVLVYREVPEDVAAAISGLLSN
jgi:hypothetical protein